MKILLGVFFFLEKWVIGTLWNGTSKRLSNQEMKIYYFKKKPQKKIF